MNVSTSRPFQIIYSLYNHEYLGYLFESFVVQRDDHGKLTLQHQNISSKNAMEFASGLDETDFRLIKLMDRLQQDYILKKFAPKKLLNKHVKPNQFFLQIFNKEKGEPLVVESIQRHVEAVVAEILELLYEKEVFEMGSDGEPTWQKITIPKEKATVLFHFRRNEENTHYFPTIKFNGEKLEWQYKNGIIVCNKPGWLLANNTLYHFEGKIDGKKLKPFLNKKFIVIPKNVEETYYKKFVAQLVAGFDVYAKGFEIRSEKYQLDPVLTLHEVQESSNLSLFDDEEEDTAGKSSGNDSQIVFSLSFKYGNYVFQSVNSYGSHVKLERNGDEYIFHKVKRDNKQEKSYSDYLIENGLSLTHGRIAVKKNKAMIWLHENLENLKKEGFILDQKNKNGKRYFIGKSTIDLEVKENNDWFDIHAKVKFGEYEIPFIQLKKYILSGVYEFELPNGEIAVIPEVWFSQYSDLFAFTETDEQHNVMLKKQHLALVMDLQSDNLARVTIDRKLHKLQDFSGIDDVSLPSGFKGQLRPYQKAGYNWMRFLSDYRMGGCLADDMGLGKTVQTLALLQSEKEKSEGLTSLLIMPTSLVYNWEAEAAKFSPDLKILIYTGTFRDKNTDQFDKYDIVITSYGITRIDTELLAQYYFNYIILDESQAIKNPDSNIAKSVLKLNSRQKLILTGTPVENSIMDLWSQMNFINPGLLGSQSYFKKKYLNPIEKKQDDIVKAKLHATIKPFILRRHKSTVAKELPEKIEKINFSVMTEKQSKYYEEVKAEYRNAILQIIEEEGISKSQMFILKGLMELRQIANHPMLKDDSYGIEESGKMEDVLHMLENIIEEDHKILIFSQFVKHLSLFRNELDKRKIKYAYLDGSTKNQERLEIVDDFQNDGESKVFLISLKAGGVGLNLTAADYVFLLDPWWNPAVENQAVDRAHRIGQKNNVFTYKFIAKDTIEEKILKLQQNKLKLATDLISTEEGLIKTLTKEDITALLE